MAGRGGVGPAGQIAEWNRGFQVQRIGQSAKAGTQDQPDDRPKGGPLAHGPLERRQTRRLLQGRDLAA